MSQKASLNLSINAIVVLILAVTMLGLGLMFMKNMMGNAMGQLSDVSSDIKDQMIERIRESNAKLTFDKNDFSIKQSESQDYYFGVLNVEDAEGGGATFSIETGCGATMGGGESSGITIDTIGSTIPLEKNEIDVQKMAINVESGTDQTSHRCFVRILKEDGSVYAEKYFYITVQ
ncbi:MAG: hypothetical protein ACOC32_00835 [Nanoarchaeota archaeon]